MLDEPRGSARCGCAQADRSPAAPGGRRQQRIDHRAQPGYYQSGGLPDRFRPRGVDRGGEIIAQGTRKSVRMMLRIRASICGPLYA